MNHAPHSPEAERAVLGGLLLTPKKLYEVAELIHPSDFFFDQNGSVFRMLLSMAAANKPIELVSLIEEVSQGASLTRQHTAPNQPKTCCLSLRRRCSMCVETPNGSLAYRV